MKTGVEAVEQVIEMFKDISKDVEDVLGKPYLITSSVSHITRLTKLPKAFVLEVVNLLYESDNL